MREFINWYEVNMNTHLIPASMALDLNTFYIKFKYILEQENEENKKMAKFLG